MELKAKCAFLADFCTSAAPAQKDTQRTCTRARNRVFLHTCKAVVTSNWSVCSCLCFSSSPLVSLSLASSSLDLISSDSWTGEGGGGKKKVQKRDRIPVGASSWRQSVSCWASKQSSSIYSSKNLLQFTQFTHSFQVLGPDCMAFAHIPARLVFEWDMRRRPGTFGSCPGSSCGSVPSPLWPGPAWTSSPSICLLCPGCRSMKI